MLDTALSRARALQTRLHLRVRPVLPAQAGRALHPQCNGSKLHLKANEMQHYTAEGVIEKCQVRLVRSAARGGSIPPVHVPVAVFIQMSFRLPGDCLQRHV